MAKQGYRVHVITGRPRGTNPPVESDTPGGTTLEACPLDVWRTTDRQSDHEAFARAASLALDRFVSGCDAGDMENVHAVMAVDWTGDAAIESMVAASRKLLLGAAPVFFLNFRLYCRMSGIDAEDVMFYRKREAAAVRRAIASGGGVMSLSNADNDELRAMDVSKVRGELFKVIQPMLREEFLTIAESEKEAILGSARKRKYLVCIVRLSADKGADRFVDVCEAMVGRDPRIWERSGVVPLMAGAASQPDFAKMVLERFKRIVPSGIIVDNFLSSHQLAQILLESALNVHPSLYEAYGMTIVEAGACGVPSLVNRTGIGAEQLLKASEGASIAVDMENIQKVAERCADLLLASADRPEVLHSVGCNAFSAATSWTEDAHVRSLLQLVDDCKQSSSD